MMYSLGCLRYLFEYPRETNLLLGVFGAAPLKHLKEPGTQKFVTGSLAQNSILLCNRIVILRFGHVLQIQISRCIHCKCTLSILFHLSLFEKVLLITLD